MISLVWTSVWSWSDQKINNQSLFWFLVHFNKTVFITLVSPKLLFKQTHYHSLNPGLESMNHLNIQPIYVSISYRNHESNKILYNKNSVKFPQSIRALVKSFHSISQNITKTLANNVSHQLSCNCLYLRNIFFPITSAIWKTGN